jgi:branched-subunit amino acid transport protein
MKFLVFIVLGLIGALVLRRLLRKTVLHRLSPTVQNLLWLGLVALLLLVFTGRLGAMVPVVGAVVGAVVATFSRLIPVITPLVVRYFPMWRHLLNGLMSRSRNPGGPKVDRSVVQTRFVTMYFVHATGEIGGLVRVGPSEGKNLDALSLETLFEFYQWVAHEDEESRSVLAAYLDRRFGAAWHQYQGDVHQSALTGTLSEIEAYDILGLSPGASEETIVEAHKRLIQRLHPDRGGSDYLAAKINHAKEVLLKQFRV